MVRAWLPGMHPNGRYGRARRLVDVRVCPETGREQGMLPVVLVKGSVLAKHTNGGLRGPVSASAERSSAARGDQGARQRC